MKNISIFFLILFAVSCGKSERSLKQDIYTKDGRLQVNMWVALNDQPFKALIDGFNNSQDKYFVNTVYKGTYGETFTAGIAAIKAGEQPHMLQVFEVGTGTMIKAKSIYRPAYKIWSNHNVLDNIASYYSEKGQLQTFPFNSSTPVMLYNKDAFRKAGIDPNNPPQTFEELENILLKLKNAGFDPLTSAWGSFVFIESLSSIHNQPFATYNNGLDNIDKSRIELSKFHLKVLELIKKWSDQGLFVYYGRDDAGAAPFINGKTAIMLGSSSLQNPLKISKKFDYGISYLPYLSSMIDSPKNSMIGGASLWALEGFSDEVYGAIGAFMKYVYQDDSMLEYHKATGYLPLTKESYELAKAQGVYQENKQLEIPYLQVSRPLGEYSKGWRLSHFVQIRIIFEEVLEGLLQNQLTPQQALDMYQERANKLLSEVEESN